MTVRAMIQFKALADAVANVFAQDMKDNGFETFAEMRQCYMWDTEDIKGECEWIIDDLGRKVGKLVYMSEDHRHISIDGDTMEWRVWSRLLYKSIEEAAK